MRVAKKDYDESYDESKTNMNYDIRIGDYVETVDGDIGYVTDFDSEVNIMKGRITFGPHKGMIFRAPMCMPQKIKRIGQYTFNQDKLEKPKQIEPLVSTQAPMYMFANGENMLYCNRIIDKINEIIAYINDRED